MRRLSKLQVEFIQENAKRGLSLNKISELTNLSKSTTHYWYRKVIQRRRAPLNINIGSSEAVGEFIGIFAGDGSYNLDSSYKHQIRVHINSKDKLYVNHVSSLMVFLFGKKPSSYTNEKYNVTVLRLVSKDIFDFIIRYLSWAGKKSYSVQLIHSIESCNRDFLIGFLRGLLDTDGYINISRRKAEYATTSAKLAENIKDGLTFIGIDYRYNLRIDKRPNRKPVHRIAIYRDFNKFIALVNPKHFNYPNINSTQ